MKKSNVFWAPQMKKNLEYIRKQPPGFVVPGMFALLMVNPTEIKIV